jgi:hypothetical protein
MKKFLSFAASALITASFLDALYFSGIGRPVPWVRDTVMAVAGVAFYILLIRSWKNCNPEISILTQNSESTPGKNE